MPSVLNNTTNKQILFANHAGDFSSTPTTANNNLVIGTPINVQLNVSAVADLNARASAKFDFGVDRPPLYRLDACVESLGAVPDSSSYDFYLASSPNSTAAVGNPAGLSGVDVGITAITRGQISQMHYIGTALSAGTALNISTNIGNIRPTHRYGMIVIVNHTEGAIATVTDETHITLTPVEYADI